MKRLLNAITRNPISMIGAAIVTFSTAIVTTLFLLELVGFEGGPYLGILAYLVFPLLLLIGLILIPIGVRQENRYARRRGAIRPFPVLDLNSERTRRVVLSVALLSVINVMVFSIATFKGVETMESNEFCGTACHSVMHPEYSAYLRSPHARVECVECHIGSGADWFAKSKIAGAWQVISVALDLYSRPIEAPVHDLRAASETCEECHSPSRYVGNRLKVIERHRSDLANTPLKTILLMRVGGRRGGNYRGIHWHVDPGLEIRYRSDRARERIYDVELRRTDGSVETWLSPTQVEDGWEGEAGELEWRSMDCVDCHNRPGHAYGLPESEVDRALGADELRSLPYIRREAIAALREEYPTHQEARSAIPERIKAFYRENYAEILADAGEDIAEAGRAIAEIYCSNVFPSMRVTWGTYPDQGGHENSAGCFRCHDDEHENGAGATISQDCDICHRILAWDEEEPELLGDLAF